MKEVSFFFRCGGKEYFLLYEVNINRWTLTDSKGESMRVDESELFEGLDRIFKLRGIDHELIK